MTDNEIIRALGKCSYHPTMRACFKCPLENDEDCKDNLQKYALDLIERQKAEIERLTKEVDRLSQLVLYHDGNIADAIKEFAERLKNFADYCTCTIKLDTEDIDNLVKEMVGGNNDQ